MKTMPGRAIGVFVLAAWAASAQAQTNFFWTNTLSGTWSGANWTNAQMTPVTPPAGGSEQYEIRFQGPATAYTADNDLAGAFALNRMVASAGTVTLTGNSLVFTNRGGTLPTVTNLSGATLTIDNDLVLGAATDIGAQSAILLGGDIS
ncbi:MAG: hypothetical protein FJ221_11720 [Lentisphaerae bacterium]|nr:hypothetical protein [Lentisphaerota bacterium]